MTISNIQLYDLLAEQLGKEKAKNLVSFVEAKVEEGLQEKTSLFATKEDIGNVRLQMEQLRTEIHLQLNKILIWLVASVFSSAGIVIAAIKLL